VQALVRRLGAQSPAGLLRQHQSIWAADLCNAATVEAEGKHSSDALGPHNNCGVDLIAA